MNEYRLNITHDEALVIFEWLASLDERGLNHHCDEAEQAVLWRIEGKLETLIPDIVSDDYKERVNAAKRRILGIERP